MTDLDTPPAIDTTPAARVPQPDLAEPARPAHPAAPETAPQTAPEAARRPAAAAMAPSPWRPVVTASALVAGGLAVWMILYAFVLSGFHERHEQVGRYASFREALAAQTAPLGGVITPGTPVALLSAPELGIRDQVVGEGTTSGDLMSGPGHRRDTPLPGQVGISVVYGRSTLFGAPFADIAGARVGQTIRVTTGQGTFTFTVRGVRHVGDRFPPPLAATDGGLTLVTSEGASAGNLWQPQRPVYVDTVLTGKTKAQPALVGRPAAVPASEQALARDTSDVYVLVLLLALVIGAVSLVTWGLARWGRWQVWLVGAPIVAATLWAASQSAAHLLPNLM